MKLKLRTAAGSSLLIAIGLVLMAGKIVFDSEPGAIPLLLVILGVAWLLIARARARRQS